ncbi:hypothetical protein K2X30_11530 [bacterium]|nr:hypothetical protein [bacterium]
MKIILNLMLFIGVFCHSAGARNETFLENRLSFLNAGVPSFNDIGFRRLWECRGRNFLAEPVSASFSIVKMYDLGSVLREAGFDRGGFELSRDFGEMTGAITLDTPAATDARSTNVHLISTATSIVTFGLGCVGAECMKASLDVAILQAGRGGTTAIRKGTGDTLIIETSAQREGVQNWLKAIGKASHVRSFQTSITLPRGYVAVDYLICRTSPPVEKAR